MTEQRPAPSQHDYVGRWAEPLIFTLVTLAEAGRLVYQGRPEWTVVIYLVGLAGLLWGRLRNRIAGGIVAVTAATSVMALTVGNPGDPETGALAALAVYLVTGEGERPKARLAGGAIGSAFLVAILFTQGLNFLDLFRTAVLLLAGFAWSEAVWYRRSVLAEARLRADMAEATREDEARLRVQEERLRIARELHDIVGHGLSVINVQAGVAVHVIVQQPEVAGKALETILQVSKEALSELRSTVTRLRTTRGDESFELAPIPQMSDLADLVETFRSAGLRVDLHLAAVSPGLSAAQQLAVYRFAQEALTNVVRHSGATTAQVSIVFPPGEVSIEVINDGAMVTHDPRRQGQGLIGMAERMAALGGTFIAVPRPQGGFQVKGRFPATLRSVGHGD